MTTALAKQDRSRSIHGRQLTHEDITIAYLAPGFYKHDYQNRLALYIGVYVLLAAAYLAANIQIILHTHPVILLLLIPGGILFIFLFVLFIKERDKKCRAKIQKSKEKYEFAMELESISKVLYLATSKSHKYIIIEYVDMRGYRKKAEFTFGKLTEQEIYNDGTKQTGEYWDLTGDYMEWCEEL